MLDAPAPGITADALLAGRPVLALAPHPDDESLGAGALLAHAFASSGAHIACLTDGSASHPGSGAVPPARLAAIREGELIEAVRALGGGARDVTFLRAPDAGLRAGPALVDRLAALARSTGAGLLLAPSPLDPHCDHEAAAAIGRGVAAAVDGLRLAFYPVWSRWQGGRGVEAPRPAGTTPVRLPPGPFAAAKAAAIAAHRSQAGLVVPDAPSGFALPPGFADFFAAADEIYFVLEAAG